MFLALVLPSYDLISMSNSNINIGDSQIKNMHVGILCMGIGAFLIIREYLKKPVDSLTV